MAKDVTHEALAALESYLRGPTAQVSKWLSGRWPVPWSSQIKSRNRTIFGWRSFDPD